MIMVVAARERNCEAVAPACFLYDALQGHTHRRGSRLTIDATNLSARRHSPILEGGLNGAYTIIHGARKRCKALSVPRRQSRQACRQLVITSTCKARRPDRLRRHSSERGARLEEADEEWHVRCALRC